MKFKSPSEKLLIEEIMQASQKIKVAIRGLTIGALIKSIRVQLGMSQKTFYIKQLKEENGASLLKALIRRGGDPNERTTTGSLPLHLAVKANLEAIVKVLIELGAEINAQDKSGLTPLQIAYKTNNLSLISFLLSKGAKT